VGRELTFWPYIRLSARQGELGGKKESRQIKFPFSQAARNREKGKKKLLGVVGKGKTGGRAMAKKGTGKLEGNLCL